MHKSPAAVLLATLLLIVALAPSSQAQTTKRASKVSPLLRQRLAAAGGWSRIIVQTTDLASLDQVMPTIRIRGGRLGRRLKIIGGQVALVPNSLIPMLANHPLVSSVSLDRPVVSSMERTGITVGAAAVRQELGYDGSGIGVAVIDSGVTSWHDDLTAGGGGQRVVRFVDFVNGRESAYDDFGHGTHVAGIIAGNGFDSAGARTGIAPNADLVVLKTLDRDGNGRISDVIAALEYVIANRVALNIRVVNLSVASGAYESYDSDPLTLAAKRAVAAGIVVVAAAGNDGRSRWGTAQYGGITAPGNAPWVLTVGASSHMGTSDRSDDAMAAFSSRGPGALDYAAKPDLVAPGVGIESLSGPESSLYASLSPYLLDGTVPTPFHPYLSLSGTSMATPVVTGTVALMVQANPALTPNQVKAILQYTAQAYPGYDGLTQGGGFLNTRGAVQLAKFLAAPSGAYPTAPEWSKRLIWGSYSVSGGQLAANANAWATDVTWGATSTPSGQNVEWGVIWASNLAANAWTTDGSWGATTPDGQDLETRVICTYRCGFQTGTWVPWRLVCADPTCSSMTTSAGTIFNVVWGSTCGGADCAGVWTITGAGDAVSSASADTDTVVWGTSAADTVVWGTREDDTDTVVWGTGCSDASCQPVIWKRQ